MGKILIQSSLLSDTTVIEIVEGASFEDIKAACLAVLPSGCDAAAIELFDEVDGDQEDREDAEPGAPVVAGRCIHLGRCRRVDVTVRYAGRTVERKFRPAARIERVKNWATRQLGISKHDANELVLQLAGSDQQPARDRHVGCFVQHGTCGVVFDLVRHYTVNGDSGPTSAELALRAHLESGAFLSGVMDGRWALRETAWPIVLIDLKAYNGDVYTLRLQCDGYPQALPTGAFWDPNANTWLPANRWPKAGARGGQALRTDWQGGTALYIPCDRSSLAGHEQWLQLHPAWAWSPSVGLVRYLNVVSGLICGSDYVGPQA